jgi:hypothetical protein
MRKSTNWQDQNNIRIVLAEVKSSPDNLRTAFKNASVKLNTTENCVSQAWYDSIRKKVNGFKTNSDSVSHVNVKNTQRKSDSAIHEEVVSSKSYEGMKIVTIKRYFITAK